MLGAARRCVSALRLLPHNASQFSSQTQGQSLVAACIVERLPLAMPELPKWDAEYRAWREDRNRPAFKTLPKSLTEPRDPDDAPHLQDWSPAKVPDLATEKDLRSVTRGAREFLYLIVKRPDGWGFPQTKHAAGETMRQAAERAAAEQLNLRALEVHFIGNAPIAHFTPAAKPDEVHFLYRASYLEGQVQPGKAFSDWAWVSKGEIKQFFDPTMHEVLEAALV